MSRRRGAGAGIALALVALLGARGVAGAVPAVLQGDPTDGAGQPLVVLPGVPYVGWGADGKWLTGDDVISPGIVGDVDVVVRTGGTYAAGSGVIPEPASGLASAPAVSAGGLQFPLAGSEVPFQLILSDGAASPAAGHPLATADMDGRGALLVAYADLDGDGVVGPTGDDPAGASDDALELQEALFLAGRRLALLQGGVASGGLGVTLGLPASAGGLGLVVGGGAISGSTPPLYKDGPWIATLLPCMWPLDPDRIIGGESAGPPDAVGLVDLEIGLEWLFCPPPGHPVLGTPYAIPLDGSSITTDLVRAFSGAATSVTFARTLKPTGFAADPFRRVLPALGPGGRRRVVEPTAAVTIADDGPGHGVALAVFPADSLGNQADPSVPGTSRIDLVASPNLAIVAPDGDGDPSRETLVLSGPRLRTVTIDDAGGANDGGAKGQIFASLDGDPVAALRVHFGSGAAPFAFAAASTALRFTDLPETNRLTLRVQVDGDPAVLDPATQDLTVIARDDRGAVFYSRTFPAGLLRRSVFGTTYRYADPSGVALGRTVHLVVRRKAGNPLRTKVQLAVKGLDLSDVDGSAEIAVGVGFGGSSYEATLACAATAAGSSVLCTP